MSSIIGYGILTLAIIWIAALVPSIGNIFTFEVWIPAYPCSRYLSWRSALCF